MRRFRFFGAFGLAAFGGLTAGGCGLGEVFRPAGLKQVVLSYAGDTALKIGQRVPAVATLQAGGIPVSNPTLVFSSSDTTVVALTRDRDTLVACKVGGVQLTIRLLSSMVTDSVLSTQDSIHVTGGGSPPPTCP
ncbi:MAG TPA: hypothetical protein VM736_01790 [Gemmatimonadales bacterium]|nr:hypothetical protein [Gemmatimonadales bacterium]